MLEGKQLVLAACTADVRQWYMQNGLQLNPDKSETLIIVTAHQLRAATSTVSSVTVARYDKTPRRTAPYRTGPKNIRGRNWPDSPACR